MKNLYQTFSRQELAEISLDTLMGKALDFTKADLIQVSFDPALGKGFSGKTRKFSNALALTDFAELNMEQLSLEIPGDQPVILSCGSGRTDKKQITPFEQLIYLPLNEGQDKLMLTLGFMQEAEHSNEMINDIQACREYIHIAVSQHKLEEAAKERKFLTGFSATLNNVKNKAQLLRAINYPLRNYLNFKYATLFVLNNEQDAVFDYLQEQDAAENAGPFHKMIRILKHSLRNQDADFNTDESYANTFSFDEISETHEITPYLNPRKAIEGTTGQVINLYHEDMVIGHLAISFENTAIANYGTLKVIANLLSTILLRLRSEEIAAEREAESEILQSLNIDFASIRDKDDLLKIIHYKLKKLFEFGHHWVSVINEDQLTMTSFLQDQASGAKDHPNYRNMITAKYTTNDRIFNKVLLSKEPHVFDLEQLHSRANIPEYITILYESGIRKLVMVGLQVGARIIGVWAICLIEDQDMSIKQLNLIKGISSQLSIAVDNIIANIAIKQKETEREKLLEFSFSLTSIRNRSHLLKVIRNSLKKIISFADLIVLVSSEGCSESSIFLATMELPIDAETIENQKIRNAYFDKIIESDGIVVFNEAKFGPDADKYMISIGLRENNYRIGLFFLTPKPRNSYSDHELELIKGIAYQLCPSIANILANEDIHRREKEKELLLALNIGIAAVRHSDELLHVITQRLKDFIGFSHMLISKIDEDRLKSSAFLIDPNVANVNNEAYQQLFKLSYPIDDQIFSKVLQNSQPKVVDLVELANDANLPAYFLPDFENGTKQVVIVRLSKGIDVYGSWFLFFDKNNIITANKLELLESIANQISVAVTNIIANQEIAQREQEKARLLSFSNAIASVRDKNILAKLLKKQLKDLFEITDYVIHSLSDDKQTYTPILFDLDANFAQYPDFKKLVNAQNNVNDGIFDKILASEDPVFFDIEQCLSKPTHPEYLKSAKAVGIEQMIGIPIRLGQENIAVMTFIHNDYQRIIDQFHLFKCILSQIALSVSNIVANEKVNRQLEEINNYKHRLEEEKIYLKEEIETTLNYAEIVGESPVMQKIFRLVAQVAPSDSTVLILGETGTGKELIARAIHNNSPRKNKLMIKVNCAALPANLIESELFGHERGSFTGATDRRLGKFELANNGTLFLDEIGEMPIDLQVKLLRALQEREIERVGGSTTIKVNVRVIAATNRDLEKEMLEGRFRKDLYYRLNIFPIDLPPLRSRKEDIPLLALYFIQRFAKKAGKDIQTLNNRALQELVQYKWPGNIRELEHLIERSVLLATGNTIKQVHLPADKQQNVVTEEAEFVIKTIDEHERDFILNTLKYCSGRIGGNGGAAMLLGIPTSTLNSKIKRLGIRKEHITKQ